VIDLLRHAGVAVLETTLTYADFAAADEIFSAGNYAKVMPVTAIDGRALEPGPFYQQARDLYWAYAHGR
jgi:branched-chain amino acid aminotransferase